VPLVAVAFAVPVGIWGMALGHVVLVATRRTETVRALFIAALAAAIALPAALGYELWRGLELERAVHAALAMDKAQLEEAFDASPWRRDKFFLGAIAQNSAASPRLLSRMADLDDPALYEPLGSLWDVMGANRKGLAVLRLVAHHPNTLGTTLAKLEAAPQAQKLAYELMSNPNTPAEVIARHADDSYYLAQWGLALNPKTPRAVFERLAAGENLYARLNLTLNKAVPRELLEKLARDPDPSVARNARYALERK